ncbi:MAG TPA: hypothetical protein VNM48_20345 [Chloroflexota bacterium]|nr:hypothetical protein [Chloroflexota bacterium]
MTRSPASEDVPTNVRFSQTELDELQRIAVEKNISRGELIRRIVRAGLPYARAAVPARDLAGAIHPARVS